MDKGRILMVKSNPLTVLKCMPNTEGWSGEGKKGAPSPRPGAYPESGPLGGCKPTLSKTWPFLLLPHCQRQGRERWEGEEGWGRKGEGRRVREGADSLTMVR